MWNALICAGYEESELREYDLKKLIALWNQLRRERADGDLRSLTVQRAAIASVMGGPQGHNMFKRLSSMLKSASEEKEPEEKKKTFISKLVAFGASKTKKE